MNILEDSTSKDEPKLITALFSIFKQWEPYFSRKDVFHRALELSVASLLCLGRKTIASMAIFLKRSYKVPVADYKFFAERIWEPEDLFRPILSESVKYIPDHYITIGVDDTRIKKTGKKIPTAAWGRDKQSPPFHTNLTWGLRELHFSIILPLYGEKPQAVNDSNTNEEASNPAEKPTKEEKSDPVEKPTPARAIPVRWINAPAAKKTREEGEQRRARGI